MTHHLKPIRFSLLLIIVVGSGPVSAVGQDSPDQVADKAYSRIPKEIVFQNDSQWEDNRWQQTDVGPFLSGTIAVGNEPTLKGIAIRVGDQGQAAVCFDTARLRISAAWTGDFLKFNPRRFGMIGPPEAAGKLVFSTNQRAGWAKEGRFQPKPDEITIPGIYDPGKPDFGETHLPKDWACYKGLFTSGKRVVLSYTVGDTEVLESPWFVAAGGHQAFVRSLEIGASDQPMELMVAGEKSKVTVVDDGAATWNEARKILNVAPHNQRVRIKLLITDEDVDSKAIQLLRSAAGAAEDLSRMIATDPGRFPETLTTVGETTEAGGPYVIDTLTLPFENPWQALLFTSGHDFFSDGSAAVCTFQGDVWTVSGIDRELKQLRWRRFATGLCQPLGLKIVDDKIYVVGRNQITRLHDRNGDGEADYYENFNNDMLIAPRAHDFVTCLDTDSEGNFYFIHALTGVMRVSADGSTLTSIADGFRNPNGMAVGPNGLITAAPQQGTWTPESSLIVVKEGGYYGYGGPRVSEDRPAGWDLPMCFIPRSMDNSGGAQVWVEGDRWGAIAGRMLHLSFGQCRMLLALTETVDGVYQGGTIQFPTTPSDFESGIMRGRFNPHDGQLYVSGLRGWQTRAIRDGCFQRVRYTGGPLHLPTDVKTFKNGIKLTFSEPLDRNFAEDPENYFVEQWNYRWSKEYGSPDFSVTNPQQQGRDQVSVESATVLDDGCSVFLEMPDRHPVNQISISWLLCGEDGYQFRGTFAHTINSEPGTSIPDSQIVRRARPVRIDPEVEKRLERGLEFRFTSAATEEVDLRTSRLVALRQPINEPPTPFLPPGPFSLDVSGTLQTQLSGFYDFKIVGSGKARLWINDQPVIDQSALAETSEPVLLHKGHNRIRISFESPTEGIAAVQVFWKGYDFGWEPVPADVLFHDSGAEELVKAQQRRAGRELFAHHRCAACHQTDVGQQAMFELSLAAPDLSDASSRFDEAWLQQWLISPQQFRPQSPMPAVLGAGEQARQDAADLVAFLVNQSSPVEYAKANGQPAEGEQLYEQLGCIGCHHFESPGRPDEYGRLSLYFADAKFKPGALAAFLVKPQAHYPAIGMPDFRLNAAEADALAAFIRSQSKGQMAKKPGKGSLERGEKLFDQKGCQQCHAIGETRSTKPARLAWNFSQAEGCLAEKSPPANAPVFALTNDQRKRLQAFLKHDIGSLSQTSDVETSARLFDRLQCANCHDRDGQRSHRGLVMAEEGSGKIPEQIPQLNWAGEKLQSDWTRDLLAGDLSYRSRPWLNVRMPAYPAYATALSAGLAAEHGIESTPVSHTFDQELAATGEKLTLKTGLDCRQCHAIGDIQPQGDQETEISLGINFTHLRDRMRKDAYRRFMLDPPRYDIKSRMIRLSENGQTTKLKAYYDGDAHQQFEALWNYIQSLPK